MVDLSMRGLELGAQPLENEIISIRVIDLFSRSLGSGVNSAESYTLPQTHVKVPGSLFDIWTRASTYNPAGIIGCPLIDKGILQLPGIGSSSAICVGLHGRRCVGGEGGQRRSSVMLKEAIIFETDATNASKDGAFHKMIGVGTKSVDNIVIIPDIDLWDACIGSCERLGAIPSNVILEVKLVTPAAHVVVEREMLSFPWVLDCSPFLQGAFDSNIVIVDLVTTTDHHMERSLFMGSQDIIPQYRACAPSI